MKNERNSLIIFQNNKNKKSKNKINLVIIIKSIIFLVMIFVSKKSKIFLKIKNNLHKTENFKEIPFSEKIKIIRMFTNNNKYLYERYEKCLTKERDKLKCIYHLLAPKKVIGKERILLGIKDDGCYVLLNDFKNIKIAYSFGIANKIQFDEELAKRNISVYMYDHTINSLPSNNSKFHWKKIGIAGNSEKNETLKTLEDLIVENGHKFEKNMILKIDVESAEWTSLNDFPEKNLNQFKYIALEYHFLNPEKDYILYYNVLKKIHKTHQPFYVRCHGIENVIIFRNNIICTYLEVSYIIRKDNNFTKDDFIYPYYDFEFFLPKNNVSREINLNILKLFDF